MLTNLKKSDIISRQFTKLRGEHLSVYNFTTHSFVLNNKISILENYNFYKLLHYLKKIFIEGYEERELGCSDCLELVVNLKEAKDDELLFLTNLSGYHGKGKMQHETVQKFLLSRDKFTICYELPVYNDIRSGFIDLIRYIPNEDKIVILDFKPKANKEKYQKVLSQLTHYRLMFIEQAGIPKENVEAYYFDENNIYQLVS